MLRPVIIDCHPLSIPSNGYPGKNLRHRHTHAFLFKHLAVDSLSLQLLRRFVIDRRTEAEIHVITINRAYGHFIYNQLDQVFTNLPVHKKSKFVHTPQVIFVKRAILFLDTRTTLNETLWQKCFVSFTRKNVIFTQLFW